MTEWLCRECPEIEGGGDVTTPGGEITCNGSLDGIARMRFRSENEMQP